MRLFFLSIILFPLNLIAQQKQWVLKGYLGVEGGESYTFKLEFTDSSGYVYGHSYTWLYENKQVKAAISGVLDKKNNTLSFKETKIISNKGFQSGTTICLINAFLKFKKENGSTVFTGPITSSDVSNVYCGKGTISFHENETLRELFYEAPVPAPEVKKEMPKQVVSKPVRVVYDTSSSKPHRTMVKMDSEPERITTGMEKVLKWYTDTVIIEVWDSMVDRDMITLSYNDQKILKQYFLVKEKKRLLIPVSQTGVDTISILAENTGNEPPNTAELTLIDGAVKHHIIAYNEAGKTTTIKIKKVKEK